MALHQITMQQDIVAEQKLVFALDNLVGAQHKLLMAIADAVAPEPGTAPATFGERCQDLGKGIIACDLVGRSSAPTFDGYAIEACPGGKDCPQ
jgi:hypothetical protein